MSGNRREELKAEYTILQSHYEEFDARALMIKSWSAPLLAGGIVVGFDKKSVFVVVAVILVTVCLWVLEAIWKTFQYCHTDRIKLIEVWFRGEVSGDTAPFQIFTDWGKPWDRHYQKLSALPPMLCHR